MQETLFGGAKQSENDVEAELVQFMQSEGWRPTRNHVGLFRTAYGGKIKIGVEGWPDWSFTRRGPRPGLVELVHVETKAPGKKPAKVQREVIASLNHLGELATWTDDMNDFKRWYRANFQQV